VWIATRGPGSETTSTERAAKSKADAEKKAEEAARAKRGAEEAELRRLAALKAEEDRKRAEVAAKEKAEDEAQAKREAEEAERQRLAKAEQDRRRAEEERKRTEVGLLQPGREFRDCADVCPEMVVVPTGGFMMGSLPGEEGRTDAEGPQRKVTIGRPFAVGKFEVTFAEWDACAADGGCVTNRRPNDLGWGRGRRPVINVSWYDAQEYAAWLSLKTGKVYRLLSEGEWEYVPRAGTATRYSFGDAISTSQAQYSADTWGKAGKAAEVGSFPANTFGLHDLHGNVSEWVEDAWHPSYEGAPKDGSGWIGGDMSLRVLRGGSWLSGGPDALRSASRANSRPDFRIYDVGFRLARMF
jgi:formylglycine-generating enzyme required for sulfatase activity